MNGSSMESFQLTTVKAAKALPSDRSMLPVECSELQLRQGSLPRMHGQDFDPDRETGSVGSPNSGIQDAQCFRHAFLGFSAFFDRREFNIHVGSYCRGAL
jgi:hypothetical protein